MFIKIFSFAWVEEDAYITFRVIDNFVNGYGLRWNTDERVQVYTHPLWMLLHIPFYAVFRNIYLVTIFLSAALGLGMATVMCRMEQSSLLHKSILIILPLYLSKSFNYWAISGLENPLSLFLLAWFLGELFRLPAVSYYRALLAAALLVLTRFDNIIIITPALVWATWNSRHLLRFSKLMMATSPLWLWLLFSLFYYGFLFPNTKYAKLDTGLDSLTYARYGWYYVINCFCSDRMTWGFNLAVVSYGVYRSFLWLRRRNVTTETQIIAVLSWGCIFHVAYVVFVGGDYLRAGRLLTSIFIICLAIGHKLLAHSNIAALVRSMCVILIMYVVLIKIIPTGIPYPPSQHSFFLDDRLVTSRLFSDPHHWLRREATNIWVGVGKRKAREHKVFAGGGIGMMGYYLGADPIIIDMLALTDPLQSRLPMTRAQDWHIGHYRRDIPVGYMYARETGDTSQMDPDLAQYYEKLRLVTSGDLFSLERIYTIFGFQIGLYDNWRDQYIQKLHERY